MSEKSEKNWKYAVALKFNDGTEVVLDEYVFLFEALDFVKELEKTIRMHGNLEKIAEFKIIPIPWL